MWTLTARVRYLLADAEAVVACLSVFNPFLDEKTETKLKPNHDLSFGKANRVREETNKENEYH